MIYLLSKESNKISTHLSKKKKKLNLSHLQSMNLNLINTIPLPHIKQKVGTNLNLSHYKSDAQTH